MATWYRDVDEVVTGDTSIPPDGPSAPRFQPVAFDRMPVAARLDAVRGSVRLPQDPAVFADRVLARIPATPPNHHAIVTFNEAGELPAGDASSHSYWRSDG